MPDCPPAAHANPIALTPVLEAVLRWSQIDRAHATSLLARFRIEVHEWGDATPIPGSYWGESEAGLVGNRLYLRADTPLHSALHEACHCICMDEARRADLHTDAGGDYAEEDAVCYWEEQVSFARLIKESPFVALELRRQGRLLAGDV